jgi:hypothetical protein
LVGLLDGYLVGWLAVIWLAGVDLLTGQLIA